MKQAWKYVIVGKDNILHFSPGAFVQTKLSVTMWEKCNDLKNKCSYVNPFL